MEVPRNPTVKHVVFKACCKVKTVAEVMMILQAPLTLYLLFLFLRHNLRIGLSLQRTFNFWYLEWCWGNIVKILIQLLNLAKQSYVKKCIEDNESAVVFNKAYWLRVPVCKTSMTYHSCAFYIDFECRCYNSDCNIESDSWNCLGQRVKFLSSVCTLIQPLQCFVDMFAEYGELLMLFQISSDFLALFLFSHSPSHLVTREVQLKYL